MGLTWDPTPTTPGPCARTYGGSAPPPFFARPHAEAPLVGKVCASDLNISSSAEAIHPAVERVMSLRALLILGHVAAQAPISLGLARMPTHPCTHLHGAAHTAVPQVSAFNVKSVHGTVASWTARDYLSLHNSSVPAPIGARSSSSPRTLVKAFGPASSPILFVPAVIEVKPHAQPATATPARTLLVP